MGIRNVSHVGLDVHRNFSLAAGRDASGKIVWRQRLEHEDRDGLRKRMQSWPKGTPVILEGTFGWGWMSDELSAAGLDPHLASSGKVAGWRKTRGLAKSNKIDADLLSELWDQKDRWWEVWLAPQEVRDQRELLRHRMSLVASQTRLKNQIHALLHRHGIVHGFSDLFCVSGRRFLSLLVEDKDRLRETARRTLKDQLILLDALRRLIARATRQFHAGNRRSEPAKRLMSLPGVSTILAYTIVAEVGRIERFKNARKLVRYSLLAPLAEDSGEERDGKPIGRRVGHAGRATLQWAWIEAAHSAVRKDAHLRELYNRRTENGSKDRNRGYMMVANRLCRIGYSMWKKGTDYQEVWPERSGSKRKQSSNTSRPGTHQPSHPMAASVDVTVEKACL